VKLLSPAWLWLAALALPIILLYMLKLRRPEARVSSVMLWRMLLRDREANAPWQRLKRNLLLVLQLLVLGMLVLSLARPAFLVRRVAAGAVTVLLDASASMNAVDVLPSRFEAAKRSLRSLTDALPSDASMSLILVSGEPKVVVAGETDKSELHRALDAVRPSMERADWIAAASLAAGAAHSGSEKTTYVLITDGGLPSEGLPAFPGDARLILVGESDENLALSALAPRAGPSGVELFVAVTNYGSHSQTALLAVYRNDVLLDAQVIEVVAGETYERVLSNLPPEQAVFKAVIHPSPDAAPPLDSLPVDDEAFAVFRYGGPRRGLLMTPGNLFLEQALGILPGVSSYKVLPAEDGSLSLPDESFDFYVLDRFLPEAFPAGNLLLVDPPPNPWFDVGETYVLPQDVEVLEHALTRFVDWEDVQVAAARPIRLPSWAVPLVAAREGPLVFAGEVEGRRIGVIAFDLHQSDLPLRTAFPILMAHLLGFLAEQASLEPEGNLQPGEAVRILPSAGTAEIRVRSPSGQTYRLTPEVSGTTFAETLRSGVYEVELQGEAGTDFLAFAVSLFDPGESTVRPAEQIRLGSTTIRPSRSQASGEYEIWPWLALAALALLSLEWWVYHRGSRSGGPGRRTAFWDWIRGRWESGWGAAVTSARRARRGQG